MSILEERKLQVYRKGAGLFQLDCNKQSVAGSVSQRACVFCGSRVVLYPIADALHVVHGPLGCAAYTWDIRGALSSGAQLHRLSFSTDLREMDVIQGGEKKLAKALSSSSTAIGRKPRSSIPPVLWESSATMSKRCAAR
jgi:nitrogenase molybdenum-cofactor synthesis protein NifE